MSDILRPETIWVEGRCYRMNVTGADETSHEDTDLYDNENMFDTYDYDSEDDDDNFEVVMVDSTRYRSTLHVSKHYIGSIIGKKGAMKDRIEKDTKTEIKIPRHGQPGDIVIYGPSPSNVKAARRRINIIVLSSRMKQRPTHFISIPCNQPNVVNSFINFKEAVLRECTARGVEESVFIEPTKVHLTFGVMCLMDTQERLSASKLLQDAKETIVMPLIKDHLPLKLRLKGLAYMNDDPREINVLYSKVEVVDAPPDLLQKLADSLVDHYYKAGLMSREYDRENVKLHCTVMNSKYRRSSAEGDSDSNNERTSFDGSSILERFGDYDFGTVDVTAIHLSQRHSVGPDGYYQSSYFITLD